MKALITGASSGIGRDMARYLSELDCDLILVSRDKGALESLKEELNTNVKIVIVDLANEDKIKELFVALKNEDIDILINNAGFGDIGCFNNTELSKEISMINVNIKAVHMLTKLFLKEMTKKNKGYIMNVASTAAFQPGPLMSTYYATKAYVLRLTEAISYELKKQKSKVRICCLCPGPTKTHFNDVANVKFSIKSYESEFVAKYAIDKMFDNKVLIIPGFRMRLAKFFGRFLSDKKTMGIVYKIQRKKTQKVK